MVGSASSPTKNQAVQHSASAPASALVAALLACVGRLRRASHLCRRQGRARKRTVKSESLRKQTLEMPQCGMIQSLTQESSQAGIKLTCGISFLYIWVNHNDQFLQPDCELSEEFKSDCLVWMLFNGKNLTAGADNLLWDNRE